MADKSADKSKEPAPSKLGRQIRWSLVAIGIVTLAVISGRSPDAGTSGGSSDDPQRCTVKVTAEVLNVRAGPGTEHPTVDRLSRNDVVDAQRETSGGFRKLADGRWAADEFVRPSAGCTAP
jgi:hypothetical protein